MNRPSTYARAPAPGSRSALLLALAAATVLAAAPLASAASLPSSPAARANLQALLAQANVGQQQFLAPDQAFRFSARADGPAAVRLSWQIAPGYYLYRDRIHVTSSGPTVRVGKPSFPAGQIKVDKYFGRQVIYHKALTVRVPVVGAGSAATRLPLQVTYQGCAEAGLCYPPITKQVSLTLPPSAGPTSGIGAGAGPATPASGGSAGAHAAAGASAAGGALGFVSEQDRLAALIRSGSLLGVLATFFGLGVLLAFTPCVLPMVPILSGLIAGHGQRVSTGRAFSLSLTYVLGMAVTYTVAGAGFAAAGRQVQAVFQQPWIIVAFSALFVAMALSMLGLFTVQMPSFVQTHLAQLSGRQRAGRFGGVAIMGALSALIVTSCIAPPLVATLVVIGQSGDVARGAAALFAMSLGMGAPLLIVGSSAGRWLPRAGAWMTGVKRLFGVMMLALAVWMLSRIVPARVTLALFALPALAGAVVLWTFLGGAHGPAPPRRRLVTRSAAVLAGLYAVALLVGASRGNTDPLLPLAPRAVADPLVFHPVGSVAALQRAVRTAERLHRPAMLDFYADWCVSCKEIDDQTFRNPRVRTDLRRMYLLRADVTANNADDQALLHQLHVYGMPTIAFYDARGREQRALRVVGYMQAPQFAQLLHHLLARN